MIQSLTGYWTRNYPRGTIHPTSKDAGILYPLTPSSEAVYKRWNEMQQTLEQFGCAGKSSGRVTLRRVEVARPEGEKLSPSQQFTADIIAAMES